MERRIFCHGVVGILSILALPDLSSAAEERFAVVEMQDGSKKISYHIVPASKVPEWMRGRLREGEKLREQWKELPSNERKTTEKPGNIKVSVKKSSLKTQEDARAYAEKLLEKVPANERSSDEISSATERKKEKVVSKEKAREKTIEKKKMEKED
ncbi:MAG: hypothetical protein O3B01_31120 [Planctomycetota bacterium]|nr:hypothetical protein [Planctomycetota bacterium]MDA1143034.1 hypothetical protein [Planctomycetota bacterium]